MRAPSLRANAVPETALVLSLVLLVLFGLVQMSLIAYAQAAGDAAAFLGGRATVQGKADAGSGDASAARALIANVFPNLNIASATLTNPTRGTLETNLTQGGAQFAIPFSNTPVTVAQNSRSVEARAGSASNVPPFTTYCSTASLGSAFNNKYIGTITGALIATTGVDTLNLRGVKIRSGTYASIAGDLNAIPNELARLKDTSASVVAVLQTPVISTALTVTAGVPGYSAAMTAISNAEQTAANGALASLADRTTVAGSNANATVAATVATLAGTQTTIAGYVSTLDALVAASPLGGPLAVATAQLVTADRQYGPAVSAVDATLTDLSAQEASLQASDPVSPPTPCPLPT